MTTNSPEYMRAYYKKTRKVVLDILGGECALCGCKDREKLEIDHKNGHDIKPSPNGSRGGMRNLWDAVKLIKAGRKDEIRLLCKRCNLHTGVYNGK